ncbi:MAG: 50S ribosomal protein L23 [Methanosarcinales archaeon]
MKAIKYPFVTEKATLYIDDDNKLHFMVEINATKRDIRREVEELYDVDVRDINTMITSKGEKKAIVTFKEAGTARELASRLGIF